MISRNLPQLATEVIYPSMKSKSTTLNGEGEGGLALQTDDDGITIFLLCLGAKTSSICTPVLKHRLILLLLEQ